MPASLETCDMNMLHGKTLGSGSREEDTVSENTASSEHSDANYPP